jgi:cytochrome c-type protein NapC
MSASGTPLLTVVLVAITVVLALLVSYRVELTRTTGGRVLAIMAMFALPAFTAFQGFDDHMETAKTTRFCLSCHVMAPYGRSLYIDDPSFVPAVHFQNHLVPEGSACFTCHTNYTLFGDYQAKLRGLRHLYVQYLGTVPKPEDIKLYVPYNNRECLHCHEGARKYMEATAHHRTAGLLADVKANRLSCASSNCHEFIHDVGNLAENPVWKGAPQP